jgi:hypothetical protein
VRGFLPALHSVKGDLGVNSVLISIVTGPVVKSRDTGPGGRGRNYLIQTGPEGKPGGESRFPLSLKTDGVLKIQIYPKKIW